ncbi:hypothetical protein IJV79_00065 [bacterium]|nr:hypothetical protein [bacterium]
MALYQQHKRNSIGEKVYDLDDIEQCLDTIFNTVKGEIPFKPDIGTNIFEAVGQKPKDAFQIAETILLKEFTAQEPRAVIKKITSAYDANGKLEINVIFQSSLTTEERSTKYYV